MKRFLFVGDSVTDAGRDDDDERENHGLGEGYVKLVADEFLSKSDNIFSFLNRGVSGDRITDIYARIKEDIINLKPDYISVLAGVNDVSHELTMQCGVSEMKYEKIYSMLIEEIIDELPQVRIFILEPFVMCGTATEKLIDDFRREVAKRSAAAERVAGKYNLTFVPLQKNFDNACGFVASEDGVHPTAEGHRIIKDAVVGAINNALLS